MKAAINKVWQWILNVVGLSIILALVFFNDISGCNKSVSDQRADTMFVKTLVYDTTTIEIEKPVYIHHTDTIYKAIPANIDTAAVLHSHYATTVFVTLHRDTNIEITSIDTVVENRLKAKMINYKILRPCVNTETTITKPAELKRKLFGGVGTGFSNEFSLNASLLYLTKKDQAFSITNNVIGKQPNASVIAYFKF